MAQSLACLLAHVVFSTKHRQPIITDDVRNELHAYIGSSSIVETVNENSRDVS